MIKFSFACLFIFFSSDLLLAQKILVEGSPESQGFSSVGLRRIDKMIKGYVDEGKTTGASYLIARNGKIVAYNAVGYRDWNDRIPLKRDDIYRIASQTKAITSVAIMMLYEEGKLLLDEPVSKYISSFRHPQLLDTYNSKDTTYTTTPAKREITIRNLLTHTSGIQYAGDGDSRLSAIYYKNNFSFDFDMGGRLLKSEIERLGTLPLAHNPGEKFSYGYSTDVLGSVVEIISGMSLADFFRTRIFAPLGMKDTYFYLPATKQKRLVSVYRLDSAWNLRKLPDTTSTSALFIDFPKSNGTYLSGGGGLSSTVLDYAIFLQMLLNDGEYNGKRFLSPRTVKMMTRNQIGNAPGGHDEFGFGFQIISEKGSAGGLISKGSYSWSGAFSTYYWVDPKEKVVAVFHKQMGNDMNWETMEKFKVLVYTSIVN